MNNSGSIMSKEKVFIQEEGETNIQLRKLKSALISELEFQSNLALNAFEDLDQAIKRSDENKVWYSIHMFLFTSRCISGLLDQIKKLSKDNPNSLKTEDLSLLLEISSDLQIKKGELFEHFGERLEEWVLDSSYNRIIENHMFQKKSFPNLEIRQLLRHFDPETYEVTFRDNTYNLKEQREEIKEVKENIEEIYRNSLWTL